jgi:hypothetical protein
MIRYVWARTRNGRRILGSYSIRDGFVVVTAEGFPGVKVATIRRPKSARALAPMMVRELVEDAEARLCCETDPPGRRLVR